MASSDPSIFRISPLIRITLLGLYLALTLPLPVLAEATNAPIAPIWLWLGLVLGGLALYGALSERVLLDEAGIRVTYPRWFAWLFRKGWFLPWDNVKALKPKTTGQGGLVYYFLSQTGEGYLLPMRVAGFSRLVQTVEAKTGIDTQDVRPLAQPWMYLILLGFTLLLGFVDLWAIANSGNLPPSL